MYRDFFDGTKDAVKRVVSNVIAYTEATKRKCTICDGKGSVEPVANNVCICQCCFGVGYAPFFRPPTNEELLIAALVANNIFIHSALTEQEWQDLQQALKQLLTLKVYHQEHGVRNLE